jgi:hypothetical protein
MGMASQLNSTKEGRTFSRSYKKYGKSWSIVFEAGNERGPFEELCYCCGTAKMDWVPSLGMILKSTQNRHPLMDEAVTFYFLVLILENGMEGRDR